MMLAHELIVGGHLGTRKTADRSTSSFHWSGVMIDVTHFCRGCDICQQVLPKGNVTRLLLGEMPLMEEPFSRVVVDLFGPLSPVSDKGNWYMLIIVDYTRRYPEAVPLAKIETECLVEALLDVFCRVIFQRKS